MDPPGDQDGEGEWRLTAGYARTTRVLSRIISTGTRVCNSPSNWGRSKHILDQGRRERLQGDKSENANTSLQSTQTTHLPAIIAIAYTRRFAGDPAPGAPISVEEHPFMASRHRRKRILFFKNLPLFRMIVAIKTTFEVFTRVRPDNSLERLTERSVGLVTDRPGDVDELFVALFE